MPTSTTRFKIGGMTCSACSAAITNALESTEGVTSASVSVVTETGMVIHDDTTVSVEKLKEVIEDCGFDVVTSDQDSGDDETDFLTKDDEFQRWKLIFIKTIACGIPILLLHHGSSLFKNGWILPNMILQLVLATYLEFWVGSPFLVKFSNFIRSGFKAGSMDVLVAISTMLSYVFSATSIIVTIINKSNQSAHILFDAQVMIISFVSFGKMLESKAKGSTTSALSALISLKPSQCTIFTEYESTTEDAVRDFPTKIVPTEIVQPGDVVLVHAGDKIPADGVVVFGESEIDESMLTGESAPVYKTVGDSVYGGTINGVSTFHFKITTTTNTVLQQIISLVKNAQLSKAPITKYADFLAAKFVPAVLLLAFITFISWLMICLSIPDKLPAIFKNDVNGKLFTCLKLSISVVVVACPCALGLAAPTAVMVGTGVAALNGLLIKGGEVLETAAKTRIVLFDKTGTLTTGEMSVVNCKPMTKLSDSDWWKLVGTVESNSEHPIGVALTKSAKQNLGLTFEGDQFGTLIEDSKVLVGLGIKALITLDGVKYEVMVGNEKLVNTEKMSSDYTVAHVMINGDYSGYIELSDTVQSNASDVIRYLQLRGYVVGMVTGDNRGASMKVAQEVGISPHNVFYEVSPIHKDDVVSDLQSRLGGSNNVTVAFVGDGINDAPALSTADVGIAISSGTDVAINAADIVIMSDLQGVVNALEVSRATFNRIKMNFAWAMIYNVVMLPFAMGCFLPWDILLPPVAASGAMMFSSLSVVLNSLLLKRWKAPKIEPKETFSADLETGNINDFNLKESSLEEFNDFKNKTKKLRSLISKINQKRTNAAQSYELVATDVS